MTTTYTNKGPRERVAPKSQQVVDIAQPVGKGEPRSAGTGRKLGGGSFELYPGADQVKARRAAQKARAEKKAEKEAEPEEETAPEAEVEATSVDMPSTTRQAVKPAAKKRTKN